MKKPFQSFIEWAVAGWMLFSAAVALALMLADLLWQGLSTELPRLLRSHGSSL